MGTVFVAWFLATEHGLNLVRPLFLPSPIGVVLQAADVGPEIGVHALATMTRLLAGLVLGATLGIIVGLAMMRSPTLNGLLDPQIESMRPVPPIATIPFFILWFGLGEQGKVLLITLGTFLILVVATTEAVRNVPPIYLRAARTLGASDGSVFRTVVMPAIMPALIGPLRVAAAAAFGLAIASEFLGAQEGLGYLIINARRTLNTELIFLSILAMGLLSTILDVGIRRTSAVLTEWSDREP